MEHFLFLAGYISYILYFVCCVIGVLIIHKEKLVELSPIALIAGIALHGAALVFRWIRLDHGPYLGLYEGLSSGLWVSGVFYAHLIIVRSNLKRTGVVGGFLLALWYTWILTLDGVDTAFPASYHTLWFVIHVVSGKLSYGILFPTFILSLSHITTSLFKKFNSQIAIHNSQFQVERVVYRYMTMVFTFATAMMISGGIWAQKAWGREWSWDSLEVWSLVVWLSYGLYIHMRITYNKGLKKIWSFYIIFIYMLTFYNIFGIPFLSDVIHKGVL